MDSWLSEECERKIKRNQPRPGIKIIPVAMLNDNYAYIIIETRTRKTVVIDPGDAHAVQVGIFSNLSFFVFLILFIQAYL